ncbi:spermidine synthase [Streptomyces sp. WMMB 322]|uniref:spermidine synthase n=1 Tax=Streptomyces sp. WMMB 322 TaxID=1286821 RepID=UPI0006E1FE1E|nr:fused MFS/spermidine synthase [Streptomyces sp. WMMB 322]SCK19896.1 Spermine/spermidine synthase [Streptomyces sp. WMMB 322]
MGKGGQRRSGGAKSDRGRGGGRGGGSAGSGAGAGGGRGRGRRARETQTARVGGGSAELVPDPERAHGWSLLIEGAPQSYVDLDDPAHLNFEYQRRLGHVIDLAAPPGRPMQVLHLGGGALTLARYVAATRPRSTQQVVESDTALVDWIRIAMPLERGWRIRIRGGDAREVLGRLPQSWADLVIADVFAGARTPAHLTSTEFLHEVRRVLRGGGLYAANIADGPGGGDGGAARGRKRRPMEHLRSQVATVREVFAYTALTADPSVLRGKRFGNAVLLAGDRELPVAELTRRSAGDPHPGRVQSGDALALFAGGAAPVTDATAVPSPLPPDDVFR